MLVDLRGRDAELTGADAEKAAGRPAASLSTKMAFPTTHVHPAVTSGIRLGTPAVTTCAGCGSRR